MNNENRFKAMLAVARIPPASAKTFKQHPRDSRIFTRTYYCNGELFNETYLVVTLDEKTQLDEYTIRFALDDYDYYRIFRLQTLE
jgi:hypothetical protein